MNISIHRVVRQTLKGCIYRVLLWFHSVPLTKIKNACTDLLLYCLRVHWRHLITINQWPLVRSSKHHVHVGGRFTLTVCYHQPTTFTGLPIYMYSTVLKKNAFLILHCFLLHLNICDNHPIGLLYTYPKFFNGKG